MTISINTLFAVVILAAFLWCSQCSAAMNWIALHEKADTLSSAEAIKEPLDIDNKIGGYLLGLVYLNEYSTAKAEDSFEKMLLMDSSSIEGQWGIAEVLRRKHSYTKSTAILKNIIKEKPDFAPAYITLAYINYIEMDFNEVAQLTDKVIKFGKENVDISNYLRAHSLYAASKGMIAHYTINPLSKALNCAVVIRHLRIIEDIAPDSPIVNFALGTYYICIPGILGRDIDKAQDYFEKNLKSDPQFADAYVRLAQIYAEKGEKSKYDHYIEKALLLDPKNELAIDIKNRTCKFICINEMD